MNSLLSFKFFPDSELYSVRKYILIIYTGVSQPFATIVQRVMWFFIAWQHSNFQDGFSFGKPLFDGKTYGWVTVYFCSRFNHIILFFGTDTRYFAVVLHTDEQPAAIGIGECHKGFGYFFRIIYAEFKILLLVLAFPDHFIQKGTHCVFSLSHSKVI